MSARIDERKRRKLPPHVRKSQEEAADFNLEVNHVYICDKCHVYLLSQEIAFNHIKCNKTPLPVPRSKNVTDSVQHNLLQSIEPKLSIIKNNQTDSAAKNYRDFPSTSATNQSSTSVCTKIENQNYLPVCTNDQLVEVIDGSSIISKTTIAKQSKQNPMTSTSLKELLKVSTTTTFTEEISEHINKPTTECLSSCSLIESFMNDINTLKNKYAELEGKVNNILSTVDVDKLIKKKKMSNSIMPENKEEAEYDNSTSQRRQNELKEEILLLLKNKFGEL